MLPQRGEDMLDLKVHTFLKVVELGSYTAAAAALHLTQPAVTQHIARLEEHYGCRLFRPEGRGVRLTEAGESFLRYARMQRANEMQLQRDLERVHLPLRLGSTLSIADYYLPELILPLCGREAHLPCVEVANTEILLGKLLAGELDAAFIEGIFDRACFEAKVFSEPEFVPVAAADHPLAGREVTLEELHEYPIICREAGSGTRAVMENYLARQNDSPNSFAQLWEAGSFALIKQMLRGTQAVSFMYEAVARREVEEGSLKRLNIRGYDVCHALHFVYLKHSLRRRAVEELFERMVPQAL